MSIGEVQHFDSIDEVLALLERDVIREEMENLFPHHGRYKYLWTAEGTLVPSIVSPFTSPFLYRGQVQRYQPCVPSVFRGLSPTVDYMRGWGSLSPSDRVKLFVERVRLEEFVLALFDHPASGYAHKIGLRLQPFGLAQHYEMATDRLDLTENHRVAAFFATNEFVDGEWVPVDSDNTEKMGVMYRISRGLLSRHSSEHFECIGKQPLPRPGEQKAYTLTLPLVYDFERLPVEVLTFRQVGACSRRLNEDFAGGASLFPPDVMAEVASKIRLESSISRQVAAWLLSYEKPAREYLAGSIGECERLIEAHSDIRISNRERITLTVEQLERAESSVEEMRATFLNDVGLIAVRGGKKNLTPSS